MIREVNVSQLTDVVERLCIEANEHLPSDVKCAIEHCRACEDGEIAQGFGLGEKRREQTVAVASIEYGCKTETERTGTACGKLLP